MRSTLETPYLCDDQRTDRTVFVAPQRAARPNELAGDLVPCPFCAGNESATPPDVLRTPLTGNGAWRARIVPNRYPIVIPRASGEMQSADRRPAAGVHDVVIESPRHARSILEVEPSAWSEVWELCRCRLEQLSTHGDIAWATVFKNSGGRAGASLEHVHSQLIGIDFVPPTITLEMAAADGFTALVPQAFAGNRVVEEAGDLVALVPPAPRQPFETWILPRDAEAYFHTTKTDRVEALAFLTRSFVARLERLVPGTDYNWWLHETPYPRGNLRRCPAVPAGWRWHLEIVPRINGLGGFELGSGCHVTTAVPEESARLLRRA